MNFTSRLSHSLHRHSSGRGVLGEDHPLVSVLASRAVLVKQSLVIAVVLVVGSAAVLDGAGAAESAVLAAGASLSVYACGLLVVSQAIRDRAVDAIADGHAGLPLACVRRMQRRLGARRYREALASRVEALVHEARRARTRGAWPPPLFSVAVVLSVSDELAGIAELLRGVEIAACPVAMMQRLLHDGGSALYGQDSGRLRDELRRIRFLLALTS